MDLYPIGINTILTYHNTYMNGLWILIVLILISALPVIAMFIWFRIVKFPLSLPWFFAALLGGALAPLIAGFFQGLFPPLSSLELRALLFRLIVQIALTEEAGRLFILLMLYLLLTRLRKTALPGYLVPKWRKAPAADDFLSTETLGSALGMLAGLGFAIIETATYGAANLGNALLRAFTAAPLHGACGSRVGLTVFSFRESPVHAVFRFLAAVIIHGMYNFMVINPGMPIVFPILLVIAASLSALQTLRRENRLQK
ncbi:MAG: PrsW family intramembrane metalloprotease [Treponema sp.]|nr:PrsW family intramembrane metalloprotease [Treponema sp.]